MATTAPDDNSLVGPVQESTKVVLLVGGLGTRLRPVVQSIPKALACVGSKSFLELLIQQLHSQGFNRLVMCTGYLADQIENQFGNGHDSAVTIEYSRETECLGTAGAIKLAARYLRDCPDFFVMNGDSYMEIDLHDLLRFHRAHGGLISIAVVEVEDAIRYGTVRLNSENKVTCFLEKTGEHTPGLINAGIYVFSEAVLHHIPEGPISLETAVFPQLLEQGIYGFKQNGFFIDIGTPDDYSRAQGLRELFDQPRFAHRTAHMHSVELLDRPNDE